MLSKFLYQQLREVSSGALASFSHQGPSRVSRAYENKLRRLRAFSYFFDYDNPVRNTGLSFLQSLLYQILCVEQDMFKYIHDKRIFNRPQLGTFDQYSEVFKVVLCDLSLSDTVIIIDALDQSESESRQSICNLLSTLTQLSNMKILFTSNKRWGVAASGIKPQLTLDLDESITKLNCDIEKYVQAAVKQLAGRQGISKEFECLIISKMIERSSENFLLVQLSLHNTLKHQTVREVRQGLQRLPEELMSAYSISLKETSNFMVVNLCRSLYYVLVAKRTLQIRELSTLLALSQTWDSSMSVFTPGLQSPALASIPFLKDISDNQTMSLERDNERHYPPLLSVKGDSITLVHHTLRDFLELKIHENLQSALPFSKVAEMSTIGLPDVHTLMSVCGPSTCLHHSAIGTTRCNSSTSHAYIGPNMLANVKITLNGF